MIEFFSKAVCCLAFPWDILFTYSISLQVIGLLRLLFSSWFCLAMLHVSRKLSVSPEPTNHQSINQPTTVIALAWVIHFGYQRYEIDANNVSWMTVFGTQVILWGASCYIHVIQGREHSNSSQITEDSYPSYPTPHKLENPNHPRFSSCQETI